MAATLGASLSALLRANGVPGPILRIEGGPRELTVIHYRLNADGQKYFDDDGEIAMDTVKLDLHQRDQQWDAMLAAFKPTDSGVLDELVRDALDDAEYDRTHHPSSWDD